MRSRQRWVDTLTEALAALAQRPARTALTALGTTIGVGAFVATTGLADTARAQVSARFDALKATEVRIQDADPDGTNPFPDDTDHRLEQLNGVRHAGVWYHVDLSPASAPRNTATRAIASNELISVVAATPGAIEAARPVLAAGRIYDAFHQERAERVALLGRVAAEQLGIGRVDGRSAVFIGDRAYTVVGIVQDVARNPDLLVSVVIPTTAEEHDIGSLIDDAEVLIDTWPGAAGLAGRQAPTALRPDAPDRLHAVVPPDPQSLRGEVESDIMGLYYALAGLALLIGSIAIANATMLNAIERRPEIGLRRALGATRGHIVRQVVIEASITGTFAAICGATLAIYAIAAVSFAHGWTATVDLRIAVAAPVIGLVTGALAGLAPAMKAAQTPPAVTLRA